MNDAVVKKNSIFSDQNGNIILEKKQLPSIYLFKLPSFNRQVEKACTKVGYTVQLPTSRTGQWTVLGGIYKDLVHLADIPAYFVSEDGDPVYFMDHAVHKLLESDNYKKIITMKSVITQFAGEHISQELFYNTEDEQREITEDDLVNKYVPMLKKIYESKMYSGFKFYKDFRESAVENSIHFTPKNDFGLRNFQDSFVAAAFAYFVQHLDNESMAKYLLSAPTRSGKSFMAASLAMRIVDYLSSIGKKENLVLVVSGIADVGVEWQETFEAHKTFNQKDVNGKGKTKFAFITRNELLQNGSGAVEDAYDNGAENVIVFLTLQDLNGSFTDKKSNNFKAHDFLKIEEDGISPVDFMIVDEAHFAAFNRHGEYSSMIAREDVKAIDKDEDINMSEAEFEVVAEEFQSIKPTVGTLYVSATPYNELIGGDNFSVYNGNMTIISKQDISNEAEVWNAENPEAEEWESPYYGLPNVYNFAVDVGVQVSNILEVSKGGIFVNEESAHSLIWNFFGFKYSDDYLYPVVVSDPVYQNSGMGKHIIITVPSCLSADAVEKSLLDLDKQHGKDFGYKVMNVSSDDSAHVYRKKNALDIKREISELDQKGEKTVVITVDRLTTGVTVKEWDTVVFWREMSSAQKFDQFKGRNGTPFVASMIDNDGGKIKRVEKQNVAVISYAPEQMLKIAYETAHTMARVKQDEEKLKNTEDNTDEDNSFEGLSTLEIIEEELKVSPTYVFSGGDSMLKVDAKNILNEVLKAQKNLGPREYAGKVDLDLSNVISDTALMAQLSQISADESNLSMSISAFENEPIPEGMCQFVQGCEKSVVETLDNYSGLYCKKHLYLKASIDEENSKNIPEKNKKAEAFKDSLSDTEVKEVEQEKKNITQRIINLISVVLMFVALSKDDEESLKDVVQNIENENNLDARRIAKHLGIDLPLLKTLQKKRTFNYTLDNQIFLINSNFENIDENSSIDEVWDAMTILINGFGRFSNNEIPTPSKVAELVVNKFELSEEDYREFAQNGVSVMDNGCKSAVMLVEFSRRALLDGVSNSKLNMFAVPTSPATYELIRKVYELLNWDITNIYYSDFVNNLDTVSLMEMAVEQEIGCQRDNADDCPFHGDSKVADKARSSEWAVKGTSFPKKTKKMSDEDFETLVNVYPETVMDKVLENIFGKIIDENDRDMAKEFWERIVKDVQKFDFVISNPPYQLNEDNGSSNNTAENIFHLFYLSSYAIGKTISMIFPGGRWMQRSTRGNEAANAIFPTVNSIDWYPNGDEKGIQKIFPGIRISDGVSIVSAENGKNNAFVKVNGFELERPNSIGIVPLSGGMASIIEKTQHKSTRAIIHRRQSRALFGLPSYYTERFSGNVASIEEGLNGLTNPTKAMLANTAIGTAKKVKEYWINKDVIKWTTLNSRIYENYKVCGADGATGKNPELTTYRVVPNEYIVGESWRVVGDFKTQEEAQNYQKYLSTSFSRKLLAESKGGKNKTWGYFVPDLEDYTDNNPDIDWRLPLDPQLYKLFDLTEKEIKVIEQD